MAMPDRPAIALSSSNVPFGTTLASIMPSLSRNSLWVPSPQDSGKLS